MKKQTSKAEDGKKIDTRRQSKKTEIAIP